MRKKKGKTPVIFTIVGILFLTYIIIGKPIVAYDNQELKKPLPLLQTAGK